MDFDKLPTSMLNDIEMTENYNFMFCFHTIIIVFLVDSKDGNNKNCNDHNPRQHFQQYCRLKCK